jgi:hypothetical protein
MFSEDIAEELTLRRPVQVMTSGKDWEGLVFSDL